MLVQFTLHMNILVLIDVHVPGNRDGSGYI